MHNFTIDAHFRQWYVQFPQKLRPLNTAKNLGPTLFRTATIKPKRRGRSLLYRTTLKRFVRILLWPLDYYKARPWWNNLTFSQLIFSAAYCTTVMISIFKITSADFEMWIHLRNQCVVHRIVLHNTYYTHCHSIGTYLNSFGPKGCFDFVFSQSSFESPCHSIGP